MKRCVFSVMVSVTALLLPSSALATPILLNPNGGFSQVNFFEPIGQSFTAEDSLVSAALYFRPINQSSPVDTLQYDFYAGNGVGGALLATETFALTSGFEGFFDFDLSSIPLTIGNQYSLVVSVPGTSPYWSIAGTTTNYAGGDKIVRGIVNGNADSSTNPDKALRVTPLADGTQPVPEPATILLLGTGLAGAAAKRYRNRRVWA